MTSDRRLEPLPVETQRRLGRMVQRQEADAVAEGAAERSLRALIAVPVQRVAAVEQMQRLLRLVLMLEAGGQAVEIGRDLVGEPVQPRLAGGGGDAFEPSGRSDQRKGGETLRPSLVNSTGISCPSAKASLHRRIAATATCP